MGLNLDPRHYDSVLDLVPSDLRDKLSRQRQQLVADVDSELDRFAGDLTRFVGERLAAAEQAATDQLAKARQDVAQALAQVQAAMGHDAAAIHAATATLVQAQDAWETQWRNHGKILRNVLVESLHLAGLTVPGVGAVAGLLGDG